MLDEVTSLQDIAIFTNFGEQVGVVDEVVVDLQKNQVTGLLVQESNEALVDGGVPITVPYRWIQAVGDIIILKHFPNKVKVSEEMRRKFEMEYE